MRPAIAFLTSVIAITEVKKYCFVKQDLFSELKGHPDGINGCDVLFGDPTCAAGESSLWTDGKTYGGGIQESLNLTVFR